jgi:polyphenol oxidase
MEWRESGELRWLEAALPGATAAFTTRIGGVSEPPFDGLNLGVFTEDDRNAVVQNRRRLAAALGFPPERIAIGRQVHGPELATHRARQSSSPFAQPGESIPEVDGHVTAERDLALLVFVADCAPVALAGPGGVAMLHCGWRGLASSVRMAPESATAGLIERGVAAVQARAAAIGPSIGPCCYAVGSDVLDAFGGFGDEVVSGNSLDLPAVAQRLLSEAGVEQIETSGLCTSCEGELFFSHRRDAGRTGRQAGLVWRSGVDG